MAPCQRTGCKGSIITDHGVPLYANTGDKTGLVAHRCGRCGRMQLQDDLLVPLNGARSSISVDNPPFIPTTPRTFTMQAALAKI